MLILRHFAQYLREMDAAAGVNSYKSTVLKSPDSLYKLCLLQIVENVQNKKCQRREIHSLPDTLLVDLFEKMCKERRLCVLAVELADLDIFSRVAVLPEVEQTLMHCFQSVTEHGSNLSADLSTSYMRRCDALEPDSLQVDKVICLGLRLGGFLNDMAWYADAEKVLLSCRDLCQASKQTTRIIRLTLECCQRLLYTQTAYCCFPGGAETYALALSLLGVRQDTQKLASRHNCDISQTAITEMVKNVRLCTRSRVCDRSTQTDDLNAEGLSIRVEKNCRLTEVENLTCPVGHSSVEGLENLVTRLYLEFSMWFFVQCDYTAAYKWATEALKMLTAETPPRVIVNVLRACGKACVVKRRFRRAGLVIEQAVASSRRWFGEKHPIYAKALLDYGFYLLNVDSIKQSVSMYEEALGIYRRVFGRDSLHVASAQEDLAYALYVLEYSSGQFYKARDLAERAIRVIQKIVPSDHLLLASAQRVKALILEEIALDSSPGQEMTNLLQESELLHKAALQLSLMAFGETNVQTAKHYGNLGRLYQSMQKFQDAEKMHLKAIAIKEELLGADDYEVGLSIGHLASLYNYHMDMHAAAEKLYFRSISISLKLFGKRYSGLEYDYRGLIHVFTQLKQPQRAACYTTILHQWHTLRDLATENGTAALGHECEFPLDSLKQQFWQQMPALPCS